jgi:hypothetical protein
MSAGIYDLYIEQGATFFRECTYKDASGAPIDLTGMTLAAQIRRSYSDPTIAQTITCTILNQAVPANLGKFTLEISAVNTAAMVVNPAVDFTNTITNYTWDIELNTGSAIKRLMQGTVYLSPEVTR